MVLAKKMKNVNEAVSSMKDNYKEILKGEEYGTSGAGQDTEEASKRSGKTSKKTA